MFYLYKLTWDDTTHTLLEKFEIEKDAVEELNRLRKENRAPHIAYAVFTETQHMKLLRKQGEQ